MNKLSLATLNEIEKAKGQARFTGYFWIAFTLFHIVFMMMFMQLIKTSYNYLNLNNFLYLNIFIIFIEFIFIYLSLFKFIRFISVISPIILLLIFIAPYFYNAHLLSILNLQMQMNFFDIYYSFWKDLINLNLAKEGVGKGRIIILAILPFLPLFFFYKGIKGSFEYHKLMKEEN